MESAGIGKLTGAGREALAGSPIKGGFWRLSGLEDSCRIVKMNRKK